MATISKIGPVTSARAARASRAARVWASANAPAAPPPLVARLEHAAAEEAARLERDLDAGELAVACEQAIAAYGTAEAEAASQRVTREAAEAERLAHIAAVGRALRAGEATPDPPRRSGVPLLRLDDAGRPEAERELRERQPLAFYKRGRP